MPNINIHRIKFFEKQVYDERWKKRMAGNNEKPVIKLLDCWGYKVGEDYERQYPIGERFVLDFAFPKEQVAIEVDGKEHDSKKRKAKDKRRDKYLYDNNWVVIRIKDKDLFGIKKSIYKNLIKEVVDERREQYKNGIISKIDIPIRYIDEDYE